jgi:signal transduction histidine kinase
MHVVARASSQEHPLLLADLPPSKGQIRLALSIVALLIIALGVTTPFKDIQLARVDPFVPVVHAVITINDLITSVLLYSQFIIARARALLVLASGYLFTALIVIPYTLTFPGVFTQTGLLGAGLQTPSGLYWFWHAGLPLAVIAYVLLKEVDSRSSMPRRPSPAAIGWSVVIVIAMVCGLTLLATAGEALLPRVLLNRVEVNQGIRPLYGGSLLLFGAVALALLGRRRRRSVLDLWLMVLCCAWLLELTVGTAFVTARFSVGWYASRVFAFVTTIFVLMVLLSETTSLYAHLALSVMRQRAASRERQISMDTMAASIAHEVNQPLGSITLNAETALLLLAQTPPDTDEARAALTEISVSAARGTQLIASLRTMFKESAHVKTWCNTNDIVREALVILDIELRTQRVSVSTELAELPPVLADRGLLQQVFLNLIMNAIDAMRPVADHARRLRVTSEFVQGTSGIRMTVEDSGTGIGTTGEDRIFEPFFTTKSTGTGIGLAICKSIIDTHGGSLRASANNPRGTIFEVVVPVGA